MQVISSTLQTLHKAGGGSMKSHGAAIGVVYKF